MTAWAMAALVGAGSARMTTRAPFIVFGVSAAHSPPAAAVAAAMAAAAPPAVAKSVKRGRFIYAGYGDGMGKEDIAVTLLQIVPSASSSEQGFGPESGDQLVAVQLRVKNLSSAPYSNSTSDCVTATDAADQSIPPQEDSPVTVGPAFPGIVDLTPGGSVTGVLTFEIGSGDSLAAIHFDPSRGDGGSPITTWKVN